MESKFNRIVWTINGIGLLMVLLVALSFVNVNVIERINESDFDRGLIVTDSNKKLNDVKFDLQHIVYDSPEKIASKNIYFSRVTILDKKLPDDIKKAISEAAQISVDFVGATINLVFFTADRKEIYKLLERNAYINKISYPSGKHYNDKEKIQPFMLFEIAVKDNNNDHRINDNDNMSYYISDLNGKNLHKITPDTLRIDHYWYTDDYSEIYFESVKEVESSNDLGYSIKDRTLYFYNIAENKFGRFDELGKVVQEIKQDFISNN